MEKFTKMDMIWVATAFLIHPDTFIKHLTTFNQIIEKIGHLFQMQITPVMIHKHLVSWENRQVSAQNPSMGGSRNRYLFKTFDGMNPSAKGSFRLYKKDDAKFDGLGKTGKTHPKPYDIPEAYRYLIEWYENEYYSG